MTTAHVADEPADLDLAALAREVPVRTDPDLLDAHTRDASRAVADGPPLAVAVPRSPGEVAAALDWASARGVPVSIRGAGSGLSGGAVSYADGLAISLEAFDKLEIDPANSTATVGAGVITAAVDRAAAAHGLMYAPDPVSSDLSTIGGNIATNAGGPRCLSYGVTSDAVMALEVVLVDGRVVRSGSRTVKNSTGLDLTSLFVGSEGALGVITEAVVRLHPRTSPERAQFAAGFPTLEEAGSAIIDLLARCRRPESLELMDANTLEVVAQHFPDEPVPTGAAVIVGECAGERASEHAEQLLDVCEGHRAVTLRGEEAAALLRTRMRVNPALNAEGLTTSCDVAVPVSELVAMLRAIESLSESFGLRVNAFAHAGDGNFHPSVVVPHRDPRALSRAEELLDAITRAALDLGGVISGEHGIGSLKRHHLERQLDADTLSLQRQIKQVLDPAGILSPGRAV